MTPEQRIESVRDLSKWSVEELSLEVARASKRVDYANEVIEGMRDFVHSPKYLAYVKVRQAEIMVRTVCSQELLRRMNPRDTP